MNTLRDFNKDAATWDENPGRVKVAQKISEAIQNSDVYNKQTALMDFGCGTGLVSLPFESLVKSITAVDSSKGMLDVLNEKIQYYKLANVTTVLIDTSDPVLPSDKFDCIISSMTMHHVKDIQPLFVKFRNSLSDNGYLCIADLDSENGSFHENNDGIFHFGFDRNEMYSSLENAGFSNIIISTATEILRPDKNGVCNKFTIFLAIAKKQN